MFQSTHPHGVRPTNRFIDLAKTGVSIHAPARGATVLVQRELNELRMFQSTHPHGVRQSGKIMYFIIRGFNLRTRTGCDSTLNSLIRFLSVSIHAPARGATHFPYPFVTFNRVSIHAPARGATFNHLIQKYGTRFQSTHPHGVRPGAVYGERNEIMFQSTHPHGVRRIR